jgi:hypothetical protein
MNPRLLSILVAAGAVALTSCGSSSGRASARNNTTVVRTATTRSNAARLEQSVRAALAANARVAVYVLWHDQSPSWAKQSTGGPALASLKSAAADRRARGVRVRMLMHTRQVKDVLLAPSYTTASALVIDRQRVQPTHANGRPFGKSVVLNERARYQLRRVGNGIRFVVWQVKLLS